MEEEQAQTAEDTAPVMPTEEQTAEETEPQLPDGVKERTAEEFEKLKEANRQLKAELETRTQAPTQSVLESLRPQDVFPNLSNAQAQQIAEQVFDEQGYVDPNLLNQKLANAEKTAQQAILAAQQAQQQLKKFEETQVTQQVYQKYPQLDPNGQQFDAQFYKRVQNELIGQMMQGKENLVEAAETVDKLFTQAAQKQVEVQEARNLKQQASSNLGTSQGTSAPVDHAYLVDETRKGNPDALAERLKRSGF